ncbi:hypothetical protein WN943_010511 [Citrus x changshan-huyou]
MLRNGQSSKLSLKICPISSKIKKLGGGTYQSTVDNVHMNQKRTTHAPALRVTQNVFLVLTKFYYSHGNNCRSRS